MFRLLVMGLGVAVVFVFPSFKPSREILFVAKVSASADLVRGQRGHVRSESDPTC